MTDTNHIVLIGRTTQEIGEKNFGYVGQNAKLVLNIAVNRSVKRNDEWIDEVSFFEVVYWGKQAEGIKQYITKGKQLCVEGYLKQDRWEKDGQKHSKVYINADHIQLLGGKDNAGESAPAFTKKDVPEQVQTIASEFDGEIIQEDIPF